MPKNINYRKHASFKGWVKGKFYVAELIMLQMPIIIPTTFALFYLTGNKVLCRRINYT